MSQLPARNPSRAQIIVLSVPAALLLLALGVRGQADPDVPRRLGPPPHAGDPHPLLDITGGAATAGQDANAPGGTQELGVDPGSGAFGHSVLEVFQPGLAGLDLRFERAHMSNAVYDGPLGWNWDSPIFMRVSDQGAHTPATLHDGRFNRGVFTFASSSGGVDTYATPNSWYLLLTRTGSGTSTLFTFTEPMGLQYRLEYDLQQGGLTWYRLKDITDTNGNRLQFSYGANGLLQSISDTVGNVSALTWITSGPNDGRLQTFAAAGGATVTFGYDAAGNLLTAQRPAPDNAGGTVTETMTYDASHRLASLKNPAAATPWLVNTYDGAGRLVVQQLGAPGQVVTANWSAYPVISVTDRLGQVTDYTVSSAGDVVVHSVRDMGSPGSAWTTTFTWDVHHHLLREVRPDGETFEWTFEASGDPRRRNNLVSMLHKTSPSAPSGLRSTWSYTPTHNKVAWEMSPRANAATGGSYVAARATNYSYDTRGNMTGVVFPIVTLAGGGTQTVALQWIYDARGRVTFFTGPRGLVTWFKYNDSTGLKPFATRVVADPGGVALGEGYAYDSVNRMVQSTRPCPCGGGLAKATFSYDTGRRLREVIVDLDSSTQRHTIYDHDLDGRTIASRAQDDSPVGDGWAVTAWSYDNLSQVLTTSEDVDASTVAVEGYVYDADGRLVQRTSAAGIGSAWAYDERDLVTEMRLLGDPADPTDDVVEFLQRDLGGRISRVDRADGRWEVFTYDGWSRLATVTDNLGRVTTYAYDEDGRLLSEELRSAGGALLDLWTFVWDEMGRMSRMDRLALDDAGLPLGGGDGMLSVRVVRDASGNVVAYHREDGSFYTRTYDLFDRLVSTRDSLVPASGMDIDYHASGLPYRLWAVEGDPATGLSPRRLEAEWTSYDLAGRPTEVRDGAGVPAFYTWSLRGSVIRYIDRNGQRVDRTLDERRRVRTHRRVLDPVAGPGPGDLVYDYLRDLDGRTTQLIAGNAPFGPDQTTSKLYTDFGLLDSVVWPDGSLDRYEYDGALRLARHLDARGNVIDHTYDAGSRLTDLTITRAPGVGGTTAMHFQHDLLDRVTLARNDDYDVVRTRGSLGSVNVETIVDRLSGVARSSRADYDPSGRLVRIQYPSHTAAQPDALTLAWDGADRLVGLTKLEGATQRSVAQFEWMGERQLRRWGPTLETVTGWDALGRPASKLHRRTATGQPIARFDLRYDASTHVTGVLRTFYDGAGNALPDGASGGYGGGQDNVYDAAYRLTASRGGILAADWLAGQVGSALLQSVLQYDRNENRTLVSTNSGGPLWQLTNYVSGLINQYLSVGGGGATYDAGGNLHVMPAGPNILTYDYANRPVSWSQGGLTDSARYDALGRRIATANAAKAEVYTYFDFYPLEQLVSGYGSPHREYVYGDGLDDVMEVRDVQTGVAYPLASNELGSPIALMSPTGAVLESYRYATFGRRFAASPSTGAILPGPSSAAGLPVAFAGRLTMNGNDALLDFRARTYLPDWGRFAEQDPLGYPNGRLNRYQLAGNNPYRKDNFGLHEPGDILDPPGENTHTGITGEAANNTSTTFIDNVLMRYGAWYQDNSPNVAYVPGNGGSFSNHFPYHALGRTQADQDAQLQSLIDDAIDTGTGWCNPFLLGWALHYVQDMTAHRTMDGEIYGETLGHAMGSLFGFDPDGPEDPTGNTLVPDRQLTWHGWLPEISTVMVPRNPEGYLRHQRKLVAITRSEGVIDQFQARCGPGTGSNYYPWYSGGRPDSPTTGGEDEEEEEEEEEEPGEGPTTGGAGPCTGVYTTCGGVDQPQCKGPTTGGDGQTTPPAVSGPTTPGTGAPPTPGPSTGGPTTGGPTGPSSPLGPSTPGNPQGPTTPGAGKPTGPITPGGGPTGPKKPTGPKTPGNAGSEPPKSGQAGGG